MAIALNDSEVRILGVLIEKRMTTPDYYPLTLNSLVTGCNQTSNRFPVVKYDQFIVNDALIHTRNQGLSALISKSGARAHKFAERLSEKLSLSDKDAAVLAELMLRGPQTVGELRQRASRMVEFSDLEALEKTLAGLASRTEPLVVELARLPGRRESRYAHLLKGEAPSELAGDDQVPVRSAPPAQDLVERIEELEAQMAEVMAKLAELSS